MAATSQSIWDQKAQSTATAVQPQSSTEGEGNGPKCGVCEKSFTSEEHMMEHLVLHLDDNSDLVPNDKPVVDMGRPFKCTECNQTEVLLVHLEEHLTQSHPDRHSRPYKCADCGQTYVRGFHLEQHVVSHVEKQRYRCVMCAKSYKTKSNLKQHLQTCKGKISFQCDKCGKTFTSKGKLNMHSISHMEKVHRCEMCFKAFGRECDLKQHQKYH